MRVPGVGGLQNVDTRLRSEPELTYVRAALHGERVSLLLPQTRTGTVRSVTPVSIHGDPYTDLVIALDDADGPPVVGRVGANDCPESLAAGVRVSVRFIMGVMVRVTREAG